MARGIKNFGGKQAPPFGKTSAEKRIEKARGAGPKGKAEIRMERKRGINPKKGD